MKTLKTCLGILCLLPILALGTPQIIGATSFMKEIIVKSKKYGTHHILLDDEDYPLVNRFNWHVVNDDGRIYAYTSLKFPDKAGNVLIKGIAIHRLVMAKLGHRHDHIDHKDGNGLNNQKNNLRECSPTQNRWNSEKRKTETSKYIGVCRVNSKGKWQAFLQMNGKSNHLGFFDNEIDAAKARDKKSKELHGEFAKLNFPIL